MTVKNGVGAFEGWGWAAIFALLLLKEALGKSAVLGVAEGLIACAALLGIIELLPVLDGLDALILLFALWSGGISAVKGTLSMGIAGSIVLLASVPIVLRRALLRSDRALRGAYLSHLWLVLLNAATLPLGWTDETGHARYLLGGKNALAIALIPAIAFIALYSTRRHGRITPFNTVMIGVCLGSIAWGASGTGLTVAAVAAVGLFVPVLRRARWGAYLAICAGAQVVLLTAPAVLSSPRIEAWVSGVLGKSPDLTGRTEIWSVSEQYIAQGWLGQGRGNSIIADTVVRVAESHNMVLELLLAGGLPALFLFALVVVVACATAQRLSPTTSGPFFLSLFLLIGLTESVPYKFDLWALLACLPAVAEVSSRSKAGYERTEPSTNHRRIHSHVPAARAPFRVSRVSAGPD